MAVISKRMMSKSPRECNGAGYVVSDLDEYGNARNDDTGNWTFAASSTRNAMYYSGACAFGWGSALSTWQPAIGSIASDGTCNEWVTIDIHNNKSAVNGALTITSFGILSYRQNATTAVRNISDFTLEGSTTSDFSNPVLLLSVTDATTYSTSTPSQYTRYCYPLDQSGGAYRYYRIRITKTTNPMDATETYFSVKFQFYCDKIAAPLSYNLEPLTPSPNNVPWNPISTFAEFIAMARDQNYYLTNDIDGNGISYSYSDANFGNYTVGRAGWFDGRGFTIKNATIDCSSANGSGFFGTSFQNNREGEYSIQNVTLENITVNGSGGNNQSYLVGVCNYPGHSDDDDINNGTKCRSMPTRLRNITIKDCYLNVSTQSGIIRADSRGTLYVDNMALINVTGRHSLIGVNKPETPSVLNNVFYASDSNLSSNYCTLTNCYLKDYSYTGWQTVTAPDVSNPSTYPTFVFGHEWFINPTTNLPQTGVKFKWNALKTGYPPPDSSLTWTPISSKEELADIGVGLPANGNYYLTTDLDYEGGQYNTPFTYSGGASDAGFYGNFDGCGHTIKNIASFTSKNNGNGIFGRLGSQEATATNPDVITIKNLRLYNVNNAQNSFNKSLLYGVAGYGHKMILHVENIEIDSCSQTGSGGDSNIIGGNSGTNDYTGTGATGVGSQIYLNNIVIKNCTNVKSNCAIYGHNKIDATGTADILDHLNNICIYNSPNVKQIDNITTYATAGYPIYTLDTITNFYSDHTMNSDPFVETADYATVYTDGSEIPDFGPMWTKDANGIPTLTPMVKIWT